jgi:hypothetical protein
MQKYPLIFTIISTLIMQVGSTVCMREFIKLPEEMMMGEAEKLMFRKFVQEKGVSAIREQIKHIHLPYLMYPEASIRGYCSLFSDEEEDDLVTGHHYLRAPAVEYSAPICCNVTARIDMKNIATDVLTKAICDKYFKMVESEVVSDSVGLWQPINNPHDERFKIMPIAGGIFCCAAELRDRKTIEEILDEMSKE